MPQIKYTKSAWDNLLQVSYHLLDEMPFWPGVGIKEKRAVETALYH
jgi:hypothetical protein